MIENWKPPFYLYHAGKGSANSRRYYNDAAVETRPRRLLIKYTISGQGVLYVKGKRLELHPGDIFVIERPGPYVYCYEGSGEPWKFSFVSIVFSSPPEFLPSGLRENPVLSLNGQPKLKNMMDELVEIRLDPEFRASLQDSALAYRFLLSYINSGAEDTNNVHPAAEKLRIRLAGNFAEQFNLSDICRELKYSHESLTRIFSETYGISPGKYLQQVRLSHALKMLQYGNSSVKEVAVLCGFNSLNYFCRVFRKTFGVTAGEYAKNPNPLLDESLGLDNL